MLASTRLPIPVVRVSDSFWEKVAWIENFVAPEDNLAMAELTLVSEAWMTATRVEALAWVDTVAVDFNVTMAPDSFRFWAEVVIRRPPPAEAQAADLVVGTSNQVKTFDTAVF